MFSTLSRSYRSLRRAPGFFWLSAFSLGAGIGLSTITFASVDSFQHPKSAYRNVSRLYYTDLRLGNQKYAPRSGEQMRALGALPAIDGVALDRWIRRGAAIDGRPVQNGANYYSPGYFDILGVRLERGRFPSDDERRNGRAVVIVHELWRSAFHERPDLTGAEITIAGQPYSVVGVLEKNLLRSSYVAVWLPFPNSAAYETLHRDFIVRLRPGVTKVDADKQIAGVAAEWSSRLNAPGVPAYEMRLRTLVPARSELNGFDILMLVIGFGVLAIATTNVSALTLARGISRRRDYALRLALGAAPRAIAAEVFAEVSVIAAAGTVIGVSFAIALLGAVAAITPEELTWGGFVVPELEFRQFGVVALVLIASVIGAGAFPAWRASRIPPAGPMKDSAGTTTGRPSREFRWLVISEVAISMVLLMLSSLTALSANNIATFSFGFDAKALYSMNAELYNAPTQLPVADRVALREATLQAVRETPGVAGVVLATDARIVDRRILTDISTTNSQGMPWDRYVDVGPSFVGVLGAQLIEGRDIVAGDRESGGAIILSQTAAKALFPHGGAVGRRIKLGDERSRAPWVPVVGIVRDVRMNFGYRDQTEGDTVIFAAVPDTAFADWRIVVRASSADPLLPIALQRHLSDLMPSHGGAYIDSWTSRLESSYRFQQFIARILGFIGTAALLLATAGLFSVLSYVVGQRTREFAVRLALGATPRNLAVIVMKNALEMALGGTAFGALLSFWASAGVGSFLYGVKETDPSALIVAEATLLIVMMAASVVPAWRATRADPLEIIRAS